MEGGMNSVVRGYFELISDWVDLLLDGEGASVSGPKLLAGQAHLNVPG